MAISAGAVWRVRIGGSNTLCSGLFDPTVVGAGTDYTEQDTAQLALTDLASATPYTTITSAVGGFTAAMVGNGIYIASGTGFTAGRYVITGYTSGNSVVLDRACATASASGGVAKVGGAMAKMTSVRPFAAAGNTILVRGQGANDPIDIDYQESVYADFSNLTIIGYNGRPKIGHLGILINGFTGGFARNLSFIQSSPGSTTYGAIIAGAGAAAEDCIFDSGGNDATQVTAASLYRCSVINTGAQTSGTRPAVVGGAYPGQVIDSCIIKDQRAAGVGADAKNITVINSVIQNNVGDGITLTGGIIATLGTLTSVRNNTIHGNGGHGISVAYPTSIIGQNVITGHTGSGKYAIYWSAAPAGFRT